jgi:hypothetical protein
MSIGQDSSAIPDAGARPWRESRRSASFMQGAHEHWLYALLTVLCGLALAFELWTGFKSSSDGHSFLQFMRQLLA